MSEPSPYDFRYAFITSVVPSYNFNAIKSIGRLGHRVCLSRHVFPDMDARDLTLMCQHATKILAEFDPLFDVLLLGGDPAAIAICTTIMARNRWPFWVGKYDRERAAYYYFMI